MQDVGLMAMVQPVEQLLHVAFDLHHAKSSVPWHLECAVYARAYSLPCCLQDKKEEIQDLQYHYASMLCNCFWYLQINMTQMIEPFCIE